MSNFDTLLLVVGSLPDQNIDIISDYTSQLFCGEDIPRIHAVSYDCSHHLVNALLKTITASASAFASLGSARNRTESTSTALVPHNPLRLKIFDFVYFLNQEIFLLVHYKILPVIFQK
jgi:hypothetical protein